MIRLCDRRAAASCFSEVGRVVNGNWNELGHPLLVFIDTSIFVSANFDFSGCGWRKSHPGVCWALGERVRHSIVAAIGQLTTRFCMDLTPFLQSAHTDRAEMAS